MKEMTSYDYAYSLEEKCLEYIDAADVLDDVLKMLNTDTRIEVLEYVLTDYDIPFPTD